MVNIEQNIATFEFNAQDIFNLLKQQSTYFAKNKHDQKGNDLIDELSISEDETNLMHSEMKTVLIELYNIFVSLSHGINNAITITTAPFKGTFKIKIENKNHNINRLQQLDSLCINFLTSGILFRWAELNSLPEEQKRRLDEITSIRNNINKHLYFLKIPVYEKTTETLIENTNG